MERRICAIGFIRPPEPYCARSDPLRHPLSLLRATAIEHLGELLPLARRADVDAHLHRQRDRRAEGVELRIAAAEARIHLVLVALGRRIEAANVEQRRIDEGRLSPAVQVALTVQEQIGRAERVRDREAQRGALRHADLERVERDAEVRARRPRTGARVARRELAELTHEAILRRARAVGEEVAHRRGERGIGRASPDCR